MKDKEKIIKILKYVSIALIVFFAIELIYFGYKIIKIRKNSTYYSSINNVILKDDNYVAVGFSDAKHSKKLKYENPGYNKPFIWVYDKDMKVTNEIKLDLGYNGKFNDIIETKDGYIVVGEIQMSEANYRDNATEGVIIKYDKDFNIVWRKNYNLLGDTEFLTVKEKDGYYFVAGSSVFESSAIGQNPDGGAIIIKYDDKGEKLLEIYHGGATSHAKFNDIILEKDGIIAVGVKSKGTGIIYKYNYDGKELWHNYYGYTDLEGLTSITKINDKEYLITGSILEGKQQTDNYSAALIKINNQGKITKKVTYQKDNISKFEDCVVKDNDILVLGLYGKKENDILNNDSVIVKYNKDLEQQSEQTFEGNKTYTLNKLITLNDNLYVVGNTDSKLKLNNLKTNGLDYYQVLLKTTIK